LPWVVAWWVAASLASATTTFLTPAGSAVADGPVAAEAIFDVQNGFVTVTIRDELAGARSAGQLISGLEFFLDGTPGGSILSSSSADTILVRGNGSVVDLGTEPAGWVLGPIGGELILCVVCPSGVYGSAAPSHEIIGPGPYNTSNSSIAGNGQHNPLLNQVALFTISNPSIRANTAIDDVMFSFGTNFGGGSTTVRAIDPPDPVPEPETFVLMGAGISGFVVWSRRCSASRKSSTV
jgi:hypothetical protein